MELPNQLARRLRLERRRFSRLTAQNHFQLVLFVGIRQRDVEHEPVQLRLRQRVRAALFDGVLRGENEKRLRQRVRLTADGRLTFLHRFQKSRLGLGRRPVDLVRQNQIGEQRPLLEFQTSAAGRFVFLKDFRPDNIRRHQIRGELDSAKRQIERLRQRAYQQRLRQTRNPGQQTVPAAQQTANQGVDGLLLPDNRPGQFRFNRVARFFELFKRLYIRHGNISFNSIYCQK